MIRTHRISLMAVLAASGLTTLLQTSPAHALGPALLKLAQGIGGPVDPNGGKNFGPGNEQAHSAFIQKNGKTYVVTVFMSSNVTDNDRPWQCKCSSVEIDPMTGPRVLKNADQVQLTSGGNGDRPCNHPRIASDGKNMVWVWGSDDNSDNTRTYAAGIDEMCNMTTQPLRISENGNNNEGAPDIDANPAAPGYFSAGYLSTGGNDISYAVGLSYDGTKVTKNYLTKVVTPANIGRPTLVAASADRTFFCAAQGNNRPPEDGIKCALLNSKTGDVIQSQIIAASDPNAKKYMNQPSVAKIGDNQYAIMFLESNGAGKNNNNNHQKGSNYSHLYIMNVDDNGFSLKSSQDGLGAYQTHAALCGTNYGAAGERYMAIMGVSPTGAGAPIVQFAKWTAGGIQIDMQHDSWQFGFYGDSGYLANIYGQNPHQQGRDFLRCLGDVPNPGHGVKGGFMTAVESLVVIPHAGHAPGDPKNAQFLSFVPGKVDVQQTPGTPEVPMGGSSSASSTAASSTSVTTGGSTSSGGQGGGNNESTGAGQFPSNPGSPNGCACSVPESSSNNGMGAFVGLGLAALFAARRRKES